MYSKLIPSRFSLRKEGSALDHSSHGTTDKSKAEATRLEKLSKVLQDGEFGYNSFLSGSEHSRTPSFEFGDTYDELPNDPRRPRT